KNNLSKNGNLSKRIERWKALLSDYDIEYRFIDGSLNVIADGLSRFEDTEEFTNQILPDVYSSVEDMRCFHSFHGHPGIVKTINTLKLSQNLSSNQRKNAITAIKNCDHCQRNKKHVFGYGYLKGNVISEIPFQDVSSDIFGPFDASIFEGEKNSEKMYAISFTDRCTTFTKIVFTTDTSASSIIEAFEKIWLTECPLPKTFLSDNGSNYTSNKLKDYLSSKKIQQKFTSVYNPTGNSISERINANLIICLKIYRGWSLDLVKEAIENRCNHLYNKRLKTTPDKIRISKNYEKI
ncbi:transposable element, partial [Pseudoloma neurophilia]